MTALSFLNHRIYHEKIVLNKYENLQNSSTKKCPKLSKNAKHRRLVGRALGLVIKLYKRDIMSLKALERKKISEMRKTPCRNSADTQPKYVANK